METAAQRESNRRLGQLGEEAALVFIGSLGWEVVARNLRTPHGEIDVLCRDDSTFAVVEVKARSSRTCGAPIEAVDARKVGRLLRSVSWWLAQQEVSACPPVRVDVISVELDRTGRPLCLRLDRDVLGNGA